MKAATDARDIAARLAADAAVEYANAKACADKSNSDLDMAASEKAAKANEAAAKAAAAAKATQDASMANYGLFF